MQGRQVIRRTDRREKTGDQTAREVSDDRSSDKQIACEGRHAIRQSDRRGKTSEGRQVIRRTDMQGKTGDQPERQAREDR